MVGVVVCSCLCRDKGQSTQGALRGIVRSQQIFCFASSSQQPAAEQKGKKEETDKKRKGKKKKKEIRKKK